MKLQSKIWLGTGAVIIAIMAADMAQGYRGIETDVREHLDEQARIVRAMLMATRRVYHEQFLASGVALNDNTLGFLPAHALSRISADFNHWLPSQLRFNNVSDRARNPGNQADPHELAAMDWFRANPAAADHVATIRDARGAEFYHFTAPIWVEPYCMKCHGERAEAPPTIRDNYATGYGYRVGDLRGVMSIKLPMSEVRHRVLGAWWASFWLRASGYVALILLIGLLMQRIVSRRLARLEAASRQLEKGDLAARVDLPGNDEVSSLAQGFNDMATAIAQHDAQVARLNHTYAALSQTNQTIVRVDNEAALLDRICRIAVDFGGLEMAWIGRANAAHSRIEMVTCFGRGTEFLDDIFIALDASLPEGRGPTATAWLGGRTVLIQDFLADASTRPWQERARTFGWGSSAAFPIRRDHRIHLVLALYHAEKNAFDTKMVDLLAEMAMDIGYALDRIDLRLEQVRMNVALRLSEEKYHRVVTSSLDGFWLLDRDGCVLETNQAYVDFSGYPRDELLGRRIGDFDVGESSAQIGHRLAQLADTGAVLYETRHRTKAGEVRPVEISATHIPAPEAHFSVFIRDLSKRDEAAARIHRLAHFDALTGLPNQVLLADRCAQALAHAQRSGGTLALMFLDLDHFKNINDTLGHRTGDLLLVELTRRIQQVLRSEDTASRLGGDEFILLLARANAEAVAHVAETLLRVVPQPLLVDGQELVVTPSMGIAIYPTDGEDFETLLRKADTAANRAKQEGRNTYRFFATEMQARSARALQLETSLRRALERDELLLHYQPQVSLADGAVVGVEALIRWRHPEHGLISPAEFIPIAESSGLILPIGQWVLQTAVTQLKSWLDLGLPLQLVAVNLSAVQFRQQDLPDVVARILAAAGLPASRLELELTESVTMDDPRAAIAMMAALHAQGVRISIDDFGTGYSSLNYLKQLRVDKLKIDQSFVRDLGGNPEDEAIVQAIVKLADTLKFDTIAEGVETAVQLEALRGYGCREVQGYYFSRPLPADELAAWLRDWQPQRATAP